MMISRWSVMLFLILQFARIQGSIFTTCFLSKTCESSLIIENRDEEKGEYNPLYLTGKSGIYELAIPRPAKVEEKTTDVMVSFSNKKKVIYACPKQQRTTTREKVSPALIQQDDIKISSNKNVNQFCPQKVEPTMKDLKTTCHKSTEGGTEYSLYEVGFKVFTRHRSIMDIIKKFINSTDIERYSWQPLYRICHNIETRTTLYTIHTLYGESVSIKTPKFHGNFKDIDRIEPLDENEKEEMIDTSRISMDNIFQKPSVQDLFKDIFGTSAESKYVNNANDYLARGHLVPDADMTFIPWKNATYIYANVVPMWQFLNNSVWKSVETQTRKAAKEAKKNYKIYTGVFNLLRYKRKTIFLGGKNSDVMPIPFYLWKIVHYKTETENKAIAFVVVNDPYIKREFLCSINKNGKDICVLYGWPPFVTAVEDNKRKTMHCCTVEDLRKEVPYIPDLDNPEPLINPVIKF